jgi:hypothetical protein
MRSTVQSLFTISIYFIVVDNSLAATLTMTRTPNVARPQTQGAGTYDLYDFFYTVTSNPNLEFSNYRLIARATTGSFADPAKLQDDRQYNSTDESDASGSVDMYANTVWSYAATDDRGYNASLIIQTGSYNPSGTGSAAPFTFFDWSVADSYTEDDNDLRDAFVNGPADLTAPYHLVRLLATPGATGTLEFRAFDTTGLGVPTNIFNFVLGPPTIPEPSAVLLFAQVMVVACFMVRRCW